MTEEQQNPASDLGQVQQGWVDTYRRGLRFRDPQPDYDEVFDDVHGDGPRPEADVQRRIVEAQMDLLLRFTGASDYAGGHDPDSWLDTFYALAGERHGQDAAVDEQLESIDQVLSQTGGPLWRPDLYLPLDDVHEAAVAPVPASPETTPLIFASTWREPPGLVDWTSNDDPAAGYLRELHARRQPARESDRTEQPVDTQALPSKGRFTGLARKLSERALRSRSNETHLDTHPPKRSGFGGMQL